MAETALRGRLERWVDKGLISAEQARAIEAAEEAERSEGTGRRALVAEALGYLGGALILVAGFITVEILWPDITTGAWLAFSAAGTVLLAVGGWLLKVDAGAPIARLRSSLWMLSCACAAAFVILLSDEVLSLRSLSAVLLASSTTTVYAAALWWFNRAALQHLTVFAGLLATTASAIARIGEDLTDGVMGLGIWVVSVLWALAVRRGLLEPRWLGEACAAVGMLIGAQATLKYAAGHALALFTVTALLVVGVRTRNVWLLGFGTFGVFVFVPQTASRYLPQSASAPIAVLLVGLAMLGVAIWLVRHRRKDA